MATLEQLHSALVNADQAGDTDAATALATEIKRMSSASAAPAPLTATAVSGPLEAAAINAGAWVDRKAAGLREAVPAPIRGVIDKLGSTLGMAPPPAADTDYDKQLAPVRAQQPAASFVGGVAPDLLQTNPVSMAAMAALDPGSLKDRAVAAGETFAVGKIGQKLGGVVADKLAQRSASKAAGLAADKANNAVRDATLAETQAAGYALPPSQVAPTLPNRVLEGFAGKLTTAQQASAKNQNVTNTLIKREIGLPADAPLSLDSIRAARAEAAQAYEPVRGFGEFNADKEYAHALNDIATKYDRGHGGMASLRNKEVESLLEDASTLKLDSHNAVDFLQNLREQGFANASPLAKATDRKLGKTQLAVAKAVEDMMARNLEQAGQPEVLQAFRDARVRIAKTFTAEKALNPATGNIDAGKVGAMFKKDKPLTGGFATVGKAAAAFPKALAENKTSMPGISPLDYIGGAVAGGATGNPLAMLTPFLRPAVRSGLLSGAYQKAMVKPPSYAPSLADKLIELAGKKPRELETLGGLLGLGGLRSSQ